MDINIVMLFSKFVTKHAFMGVVSGGVKTFDNRFSTTSDHVDSNTVYHSLAVYLIKCYGFFYPSDDENFLSCPLCDVTAASPGQLKEHMQRTHIPEETKYRCEYCPFWSEEKK